MRKREQAEAFFLRIGWGKENAVTRPQDSDVDRILRDLIEKYNSDINKPGVIINVGDGYYMPRKWILAENLEYKKYRRKDRSREKKLHHKGTVMDCKFYSSSVTGITRKEIYEQLSLPV